MPPLKVTCLISAYNAQDTIGRTIKSILSQEFHDFEILIINDGSTDNTVEEIEKFEDPRIRLVSQPNAGLYPALARGVEMARGKYIARLDADDEALPGRLQNQADFLDSHPEIMLVGGGEERVDDIRHEIYIRSYPQDDKEIRQLTAKCMPYAHSAWMFRRSLLDHGLNYDTSYDFMGDFDYFIRIAAHHKVANLPTPVVRRYVSSTSFFQANFKVHRQNRRLAKLSSRAIHAFNLPVYYYLYPLARMLYPLIPNGFKRLIRRKQGLQEVHG